MPTETLPPDGIALVQLSGGRRLSHMMWVTSVWGEWSHICWKRMLLPALSPDEWDFVRWRGGTWHVCQNNTQQWSKDHESWKCFECKETFCNIKLIEILITVKKQMLETLNKGAIFHPERDDQSEMSWWLKCRTLVIIVWCSGDYNAVPWWCKGNA